MSVESYIRDLARGNGQDKSSSPGNPGVRAMYPAIVVNNIDPLEQGRVVARIVAMNEKGEIYGGKDNDIIDNDLPYAIPYETAFIHSPPMVGEMVIITLENPSDLSSPRYFVGPIHSSKLKLRFQSYQEAIKIFDYSNFNLNQRLKSRPETSPLLPKNGDVALQGRDDAWVILRPREAILTAGIFKKGGFDENRETPSLVRVRQNENSTGKKIKSFSTLEAASSVVQLYSPLGQFRDKNIKKYEINDLLEELGEMAQSLHPSVYGDELVKVLDIIIRVLLNHIHTPQKPALETPELKELQAYTIEGNLQKILSNFVRIN